jgi:hypothetical protein
MGNKIRSNKDNQNTLYGLLQMTREDDHRGCSDYPFGIFQLLLNLIGFYSPWQTGRYCCLDEKLFPIFLPKSDKIWNGKKMQTTPHTKTNNKLGFLLCESKHFLKCRNLNLISPLECICTAWNITVHFILISLYLAATWIMYPYCTVPLEGHSQPLNHHSSFGDNQFKSYSLLPTLAKQQ